MKAKLSTPQIAKLVKEICTQPPAVRSFEYDNLCNLGIDDTLAGDLAFSNDGVQELVSKLEERATEMTPASQEDTLKLVSLLKR